MFNYLKKYFSPIQMQLLKRGLCVACLMPLAKSDKREKRGDNEETVTCKCGRIFIHTKSEKSYRRARLDEV